MTREATKGERCSHIRGNGTRCKNILAEGFEKCWLHLGKADKKRYVERRGLEAYNGDKRRCIHRVVSEQSIHFGLQCSRLALPGHDSCFTHLSPRGKRDWRAFRRKSAGKYREIDYQNRPPKTQRKAYDGHHAKSESEEIVRVEDGTVYGFYGGAFLNQDQRELYQSAPVGDIDDDIKIIRFLINDALQNQMLYIQAQAEGSVKGGFTIFSKEVSETLDDDGRVIASSSRTIKRRRDYLQDIHKLERLLTVMESSRVDIKKASAKFDDTIVPFHFNLLPPSDDHPQYGGDEAEEDAPEGVEKGGA